MAANGAVARRGDLVLVEYRPDYTSSEKAHTFAIERVTGVTRDGWVRATVQRVWGQDREEPLFRMRTSGGRPLRDYRTYYVNHYVISAGSADVARLWEAWCTRRTDWRVPPFQSMAEATAFVAPFRRAVVAAS
jgi:hypothetical protein